MSDLSESRPTTARRGSRGRLVLWVVLALVLLLILAVAWIGVRGLMAKRDLEQSVQLVGTLRSELVSGDSTAAQKTADDLQDHAAAARSLTGDPVWSAFQVLPFVGSNLRAVREVAVVVDDVATGAVKPVAGVIGDVNVKAFAPKDGKVDLAPLVKAQPAVQRATTTLAKADRDATAIDTSDTLSPVTGAVNQLRNAVASVSAQADVANRAVQLAPAMLGQDGDRRYLLLFQNNAELRAGGGIPGAVALLDVRDGAIHLSNQASGSSFGQTEQPVLPLSTDTQGLYGPITGEYMQDVTLTPRFDVSAELAREMWKQRFGQQVDGVLAMDPVTLASILKATGPVQLPTGDTLTSDNAVKLLLSDVYAKYPDGNVQDAFFASAASAVFDKVSSGAFDPKAFISALTDGVQENRLRLWSADSAEQKRLVGTAVAGPLPASSASERQFGIYLNDATGAKMDFYLQKTVAVGSAVCRADGRPTSVVQVTLKNTAPADAATSLPEYVTGGGNFGVEPGKVQTNVAVYAAEGEIYLGSTQDGKAAAPHTAVDGDHPVVQVQTLLAPGQSTTFRVTFLGSAKQAKAAVTAVSTPTIEQSPVQPAMVDCGKAAG
jgi:cell division protein FtsB